MSIHWENIVSSFFEYGLFFYSVTLLCCYIGLSFFSMRELNFYERKTKASDFKILAPSSQSPSISILAPAYNESATIIENIKSLLTIYYNDLQIVVINDGSKDDSIEKMVAAYDLVQTDLFVPALIQTKPVRAVYKSTNPAYQRLLVVDKENGGKADSLNAGINISSGEIIVCVDVDCILEQDALFKIVKPFLENSDKRVIASGGVVRIANSCVVEHGKLVQVNLPTNFLAKMQSLEYIRSFLLGRMAWSRLNGLLLISGAFGAFDKSIVIACGGYNTNTVGEDMELVVRMRRYMHEQGLPYAVVYIPEPLCWTEAPVTAKVLQRQRNRWTRGTIETLRDHRRLFFNPKFGLLGMLSYPYWFFFEMMAAPIEFFGILFFGIMGILGEINWPVFGWFFAFIWSCAFFFSAIAILMEASTFNQYKNKGDLAKLLLMAMIEPFVYHPFVVWSAINGFADYFQDVKSWGVITRAGFAPQQTATPALIQNTDAYKKNIYFPVQQFAQVFLTGIILFLLFRGFEFGYSYWKHGLEGSVRHLLVNSLLADFVFLFSSGITFFIPFTAIYQLHQKTADWFLKGAFFVLILMQIFLSQYFLTTLVPLGADVWGYSMAEIKLTVGASGVLNFWTIALIMGVMALLVWVFKKLPTKLKVHINMAWLLVASCFIVILSKKPIRGRIRPIAVEYNQNLSVNKPQYFYSSSIKYFFPKQQFVNIYDDQYSGDFGGEMDSSLVALNYIEPTTYPFLHSVDSSADKLSPFFNKGKNPPNIVLIMVEGLGRAFTNKGAYMGNFTPFLDSLSKQSLYWPNFLSEGGRTFAVLPSVLGSLPFGKNGFSEMGTEMPEHISLASVLGRNGYQSSFYYGGDAHFDFMDDYLRKAGIGKIQDIKSFGVGYQKMPSSSSGFSWGYGDRELFRRYFAELKKQPAGPYVNAILTLSTHSPFLVNDQQKYLDRFETRMTELEMNENAKKSLRQYKQQLASVLFLDNALQYFFNEYSKQPEFANTVFVVTGDHRLPEIPMTTKLDRYHVPLIIYSAMLKRPAQMHAISTHYDITPSILQWLKNSYQLSVPETATWMGAGLDTTKDFNSTRAYPLMQTKNEVNGFILGKLFQEGNQVFKINAEMNLSVMEEPEEINRIKAAYNQFKTRNNSIQKNAKILPDSLLSKYGRVKK
jgi:cellulose synthase/poly-beta-1,6-N-acetylglucosamine synthase-like glycosyltransferase/phosphoglycerol transferase MdoB-like AlkP superfamily enzyme